MSNYANSQLPNALSPLNQSLFAFGSVDVAKGNLPRQHRDQPISRYQGFAYAKPSLAEVKDLPDSSLPFSKKFYGKQLAFLNEIDKTTFLNQYCPEDQEARSALNYFLPIFGKILTAYRFAEISAHVATGTTPEEIDEAFSQIGKYYPGSKFSTNMDDPDSRLGMNPKGACRFYEQDGSLNCSWKIDISDSVIKKIRFEISSRQGELESLKVVSDSPIFIAVDYCSKASEYCKNNFMYANTPPMDPHVFATVNGERISPPNLAYYTNFGGSYQSSVQRPFIWRKDRSDNVTGEIKNDPSFCAEGTMTNYGNY
jgi:hypothetical protein